MTVTIRLQLNIEPGSKEQLCPGVSFDDELKYFEATIASPREEGSPK